MITFLKRDLNSIRDEPCEDPGAQELTMKGKTRGMEAQTYLMCLSDSKNTGGPGAEREEE